MSFEFQSKPTTGYTELTAEHQLLADWVALHPRRGVAEYLDHRMVDRENRAAAYYIHGLGMGDGKRFALIQGRGIVIFDAVESLTPEHERVVQLSSVEIPEMFDTLRDDCRTLMVEACRCYARWVDRDWPRAPILRFDFDERPWRVVPTKYSRLYWLEQARRWKAAAKPKALAAWRSLTSPLASAVAFVVLVALSLAQVRIPLVAVMLAACWFWWRLSRYDDDLVFGHWLIGRTKLKSPFSLYQTISRLQEPRPLHAFKVTLTRPRSSQPDRFTLKVLNTSWYPAFYFSISAKDVADLVAPGFSDTLRAVNKGAIDPNALHAAFSDLRRRWLLPRQTVEWHVKAKAGFPIEKPAPKVVAIVAISRRVSGEPKHGPQSFLLPVEVLSH